MTDLRLPLFPRPGTGPGPAPAAPTRRTYAALAAGVAAFIVYGSLVPFTFEYRPFGDAVRTFRKETADRVWFDSRSDALANVLIAVPLGFALLGARRADRPGRAGDLRAGLVWLPACVGLAVLVEFGQVYLPSRVCSGSDVWCQGLGAAVGMAGWVVAGRQLTGHARVVWGRTRGGGAVGRLLLAYLALLGFIQTLPFDLTPSPKALYLKLRDDVVFVPFGEFRGAGGDRTWALAAKLVKLAGLYLPAGLFAAALPGRAWGQFPRVLAAAAGVACGLEAVQLVLHSRTPGATDVIAGTVGALAGWAIGRRVWAPGVTFALGLAWAAILLGAYWQPFDFRGRAAFDWRPGMPVESGNPLFALEDLLTKLVLFAPFGVVVVAAGAAPPGWGRLAAAAGVGVLVSAVIESGQRFLPGYTPGVTDVLFAGAGAVAGAWVAGRVREARAGTVRPGVY